MFLEYLDTNVIRFPVDPCRAGLDALIALEPDILLADRLAELYDLEPLPFDSIEAGEAEGRALIAELRMEGAADCAIALRRMRDGAVRLAIGLCRQAHAADEVAAAWRLRADRHEFGAASRFDAMAVEAARASAVLTIDALAAAHRARGIDAVIRCALSDRPYVTCYGMIDFG